MAYLRKDKFADMQNAFRLACLLLLPAQNVLTAQTSTALSVRGTLCFADSAPAANQWVYLEQSGGSDSALTLADGLFYFATAKPGPALIRCSYMATTVTLNIIVREGDSSWHRLYLPVRAAGLPEVSIAALKRGITISGDKIIVDAAVVNPGAVGTLLDLLQKCPGLLVDEQREIISMRGRPGVGILVNGRLFPQSGTALFNWMKSTPANTVSSVELMSQPSARYDAAGSAGLVNIVMAGSKSSGSRGSISAGLGQGRYGKSSLGAQYQLKKGNINWFNQISLAQRKSFNQLSLVRDFDRDGEYQAGLKHYNYLLFPSETGVLKSSVEYKPNPLLTLGGGGSVNLTSHRIEGIDYATMLDSLRAVSGYFTTINNTRDFLNNRTLNAYLTKVLDSAGSQFSTDVDFAWFGNDNRQLFQTTNYDKLYVSKSKEDSLEGRYLGNLAIAAMKMDWLKKYKGETVLEAGTKISRVRADNHARFLDVLNGVSALDSSRSNHFIFTEVIWAAYAQLSGAMKSLKYQAGLRQETTWTLGRQLYDGQRFSRAYTRLFPTLSLQKLLAGGRIHSLSLTRRIERPEYDQLNPFRFFINNTTYKTGEPRLLPQMIWSAEWQDIGKGGQVLSLNLSHTGQMITEVLTPAEPGSRITIQTNRNLNQMQSASATYALPLKLGKKSQGFWSLTAAYQYFKGNVSGTSLSEGSAAFSMSGMQQFRLGHGWAAEVNGMFQSGQIYGYMRLNALGQLGFSCQKQVLKQRGTMKLAVTDVLFTANPVGKSRFNGYTEKFDVLRETRVAMLSFSYRFGEQLTPANRRPGGAEEEKQRATQKLG